MKLLEIIPGDETLTEIVDVMRPFCENKLGKGVVIAKDTPNFIANRIGAYSMHVTLNEMLAKGYTIEEIDACTGPAIGRPKSATFRTLDIVGLDTFVHIANNMYEKVSDEAEKKVFKVPEILQQMVDKGWIGEKAEQAFIKR